MEYLPENRKLKEKIEEMKKKVEISQTVGTEDQLLQILNFAGLRELEKLKRIGPAKAKKIMKGREDGLYNTVRINRMYN